MEILPFLRCPTIDKIGLFTSSFDLSSFNKLQTSRTIYQGSITSEKKIFNSTVMNVTIKKNFHGVDVMQLMFNPNKVSVDQVKHECDFVGLDFDLMNSKLNRVDIERHQKLNFKLSGYHSLLSHGTSGNHIKGITNSTFRLGTSNVGIQLYDKSAKEKLDVQGIVRVETQIKKPEYLNRNDVFTLNCILSADEKKLMELYNIPKKLYLRNLDSLRNNEHDISDLVTCLNDCVENNQKFLQAFFTNFAVNEIGLEKLFNVFDCANLTSKQKSNAKKYVRESGIFSQLVNSRSMVDEILSYFTLAA
jgi:hypothetical protein